MHNEHPRLVVASGGFDPLHRGHVDYLTEARKLGDRLIVALASDQALIQKKNNFFMSWEQRAGIIKCLKPVDEIILVDDYYNHYQTALHQIRKTYPSATIIFACGDTSSTKNTPKLNDQDVVFEHNVGSIRETSSSAILRTYAEYVRNMQELESGPNGRYR